MTVRRVAGVAAVTVLALVAAGCSGGGHGTTQVSAAGHTAAAARRHVEGRSSGAAGDDHSGERRQAGRSVGGALEAGPEIQVKRNARVIQVSNRTFWKGSLIKRATNASGKGKPEPTKRLVEVGDFNERIARQGKTLVVTNKPVRCALTGEDEHSLPISTQFRGADIAHFGNLRGSNEFEGHDAVIILGRDEPTFREEERAMAIWYDTKEPIGCIPEAAGRVNYRKRARRYLMRDGSTKAAVVTTHPDPRVQAVVEQGREAEMLQAIDRLRLIHNKKRKTVYILCSIPLGLPVDELVTWRELIGDRRLRDALAECDTRGWDALSLATELRFFADGAAKKWPLRGSLRWPAG